MSRSDAVQGVSSATASRISESLERQLLTFERAWRSGQQPSIQSFLTDSELHAAQDRRRLLIELALIDMEYRWRRAAEGRPVLDALGGQPRWSDYLRQFSDLGELHELAPEWLAEEYRVRMLWGDRPKHDHFLASFPGQLIPLARLLRQIDRELEADAPGAIPIVPTEPFQPTCPDPRAPLLYSDFIIEEHLATGGMGKVYRAVQRSLDRPVALKALLKSRQHDPEAVERFLQEGRLLARLKHPNIVGIYGAGRFPGGGHFLAIELIEGSDLSSLLSSGPVEPGESVRVSRAVASAIQHAHALGILHCDLKPANVLIDANGHVFVTDFGLAQLLPDRQGDSHPPNAFGGTLGYLAPEQLDDSFGQVSAATDVYGIGAILYAALTACPPRPLEDIEATLSRLRDNEPVVSPSAICGDVPSVLEAVCLKCLATPQAGRFASAADVALALDECGTVE